MPVLNEPFLVHVIRQLKQYGVTEIILTQGHLSNSLRDYFGNGEAIGVSIKYVIEPEPLGTGGAIKNAERLLNDGTFFVLNGDIFTTIDLLEMLNFHRQQKAAVTLASIPVPDPTPYGLIETDNDNRILTFREKPSREHITTNFINAGIYLIEANVLKSIASSRSVSVEREVFPDLLKSGKKLYAYKTERYWIDIGSTQKYFQLNVDLAGGDVIGFSENPNLNPNAEVHPSAKLSGRVILGDGCCVEAETIINGPAVIGNNCRIGAHSVLKQSVLWDSVCVGGYAIVEGSVIGSDSLIGSNTNISNSILSDNTYIGRDLSLAANSRIWPGTIIS